jgi:hypothetical protein
MFSEHSRIRKAVASGEPPEERQRSLEARRAVLVAHAGAQQRGNDLPETERFRFRRS